jgi:Predicted transcriptional regulators
VTSVSFVAPELISLPSSATNPARPSGAIPANARRFEAECVQFFAEAVQLFGIPKSVGQIYGVLYASPRPLGFLDIVERLEISKGSASQGMQLLRELGAINEVRGKGRGNKSAAIRNGDAAEGANEVGSANDSGSSRGVRVLYEPELSLRRLVSGVLRERIAPMAATNAERLANLKSLAAQAGPDGKFYLARAKQLNTWRRRMRAVLPVLMALLGPVNK